MSATLFLGRLGTRVEVRGLLECWPGGLKEGGLGGRADEGGGWWRQGGSAQSVTHQRLTCIAPPSSQQPELDELFGKFGKVNRLDIKRGQSYNFAFVEFGERRDAEDAQRDLDGKELSDGSRVVIEFAKGASRPPRETAVKVATAMEEDAEEVAVEATTETADVAPHVVGMMTATAALPVAVTTTAVTTVTVAHPEETSATVVPQEETTVPLPEVAWPLAPLLPPVTDWEQFSSAVEFDSSEARMLPFSAGGIFYFW
ncbi:hypothetical protein BC830DRAFT_1168222 [Chytriomyces sp. MP71]|nr:hypothetical protein BC830DRAFT_1168222 [Chytriomyces sp. MP71]